MTAAHRMAIKVSANVPTKEALHADRFRSSGCGSREPLFDRAELRSQRPRSDRNVQSAGGLPAAPPLIIALASILLDCSSFAPTESMRFAGTHRGPIRKAPSRNALGRLADTARDRACATAVRSTICGARCATFFALLIGRYRNLLQEPRCRRRLAPSPGKEKRLIRSMFGRGAAGNSN